VTSPKVGPVLLPFFVRKRDLPNGGNGVGRDESQCKSRVAKVNAVPTCYVGVWRQPIRRVACPPSPTQRSGVRASTRPSGGYAFEGRRRTAVAPELGSCAQLVFPLIFPLSLLFHFISSPFSLCLLFHLSWSVIRVLSISKSTSVCSSHFIELRVVVDQLTNRVVPCLRANCKFEFSTEKG
jgi:hypothetical protein